MNNAALAAQEPIVTIKQLSRRFGRKDALNEVSVAIPKGAKVSAKLCLHGTTSLTLAPKTTFNL